VYTVDFLLWKASSHFSRKMRLNMRVMFPGFVFCNR
jgi:hypothetical protein